MKKGTLSNAVRTMRRAVKFAGKDFSREILTNVHFAENGDIVATDSWRMYVEPHVWDGDELNIPLSMAQAIAKKSVKVESAVIESEAGRITAKLSDGTVLVDEEFGGAGKYPLYGKLFEGLDERTVAYVNPKQLLPIARAHVKSKSKAIRIDVRERDFTAQGAEGEVMPSVKFDKACDGDDIEVGISPKFLRDTLNAIGGDAVRIGITSHIKPITFSDLDQSFTVLVMPVRIDLNREVKPNKKPERKPLAPEKVDVRELKMALYAMAVDRAAEDADSRMRGGNASEKERSLVWRLQKDGRLDHETFGNYTTWKLDGEFVTCIERRWSKRKIHLHYPELKPLGHDENIVAKLAAEELKREKFAKAFAEKCEEKTGIKLDVKPIPGGGSAAGFKQEPKKEETDMTDELKARIEELEAQLKARNDELEQVWKENESLKRSKPEPKAEAPKPEPAKAEHETVAEVSLNTMKAWCEGKGLIATQKREGACIWVEGDSKPYANELKELGFRFAKKRKSWYFSEA